MLASITRTTVPLLVGYFLAWPAANLLGLTEEQVTSLITIVISALYYLAVRGLEKVAPQFGWLLGYASAPTYAKPAVPGGPGGPGEPDVGGADWQTVLIAAAVCIVILAVALVAGIL